MLSTIAILVDFLVNNAKWNGFCLSVTHVHQDATMRVASSTSSTFWVVSTYLLDS